MAFSGGVVYVKRAGAVVGELDLKGALVANGFKFEDGVDEVQVTLGDNTEGIATNVSARLFVDGNGAGTALGGAERTGEEPQSVEFFGAASA